MDRPVITLTTRIKGRKKGEYTRVELHFSKLDILLFMILAVAVYGALQASRRKQSGSQFLSTKLTPFQTKLLNSSAADKQPESGTKDYDMFGNVGNYNLGGGMFAPWGGASPIGAGANLIKELKKLGVL